MTDVTYDFEWLNGDNMQQIRDIVSQLRVIMQDNDISQNALVNALDGKCAKNTILTFCKGDADCKLSTLLMVLDACGVELRLDTERSREAITAGDIAAYRVETDHLTGMVEKLAAEKEALQVRYSELIEKNTALTNTVEKQQAQIERYMARMEKADNELYSAMADIRRKDAKIVELMGK